MYILHGYRDLKNHHCLRSQCPPWVDLHNFPRSKIDPFGQPNPFHQRRMNSLNLAVHKKNMSNLRDGPLENLLGVGGVGGGGAGEV